MIGDPVAERYRQLKQSKIESSVSAVLKNCEFWIWDRSIHEKLFDTTGGACCFWHIIGLPEKEHLIGKKANGQEILEVRQHGMKHYEKEWFDAMKENRYIWIKKAAGMGATTFFLGYMAWLCLRNDDWKDASMGIVTGPRINIAVDEIKRIPQLFRQIDYRPRVVGTAVTINGCRIEAYPSHTFDTARGLEKVRFFFVDEGDFFPKSQQLIVRGIVERYEAKTHPFVIFNSTANLPGGLYETMEKETDSIYTKIFSLVDKGITDKIYTDYEIEQAKKSLSYPSEYEGQYGVGRGNIFNYKLLDEITEQYMLEPQGGIRILNVDPAFGSSEDSSKFGYVGFEKREEIKYVVDAGEFPRASPEGMMDWIASKFHDGRYTTLQVDSAFPGLIRDWQAGSSKTNRKPVNTKGIVFKDVLTEMTTNSMTQVQNKDVRIHPAFAGLISQLKSIEFNDRGHPNKKKLTFDQGDCFLMGLNYWRTEVTFRKLKGKF